MKVMTVVGARPNFMKAAPVIAAIRERNQLLSAATGGESAPEAIQQVLVHTGQHYDQLMSDSFFKDLNLPKPDAYLGVGSGSHANQTAEIMRKFEAVLLQEKPHILVVVGDVNSTVACALVAAKISYDASGTRPLIAHVEAGLRSFDRTMPEEINRILTDHLSDLLFVTEESGLRNLASEGICTEKIHFVGNTMIDSLLACKEKAESSSVLSDLGLCKGGANTAAQYALLTLHRPANVDSREAFLNILEGLRKLAEECPVVFPAHPRTQKRIREFGLEHRFDWDLPRSETAPAPTVKRSDGIRITEPVGYLDFVCLMSNAALVVTDSGGIQEETTCLGVPCVTVRENTERPVTVTVGTNVLAGVGQESIREAVRRQLESRPVSTVPENWDGKSAARILDVICQTFQREQSILGRVAHLELTC
jgi:UDP-N-acetylglucosamine 2-epimerase (non-hydrolysing)